MLMSTVYTEVETVLETVVDQARMWGIAQSNVSKIGALSATLEFSKFSGTHKVDFAAV